MFPRWRGGASTAGTCRSSRWNLRRGGMRGHLRGFFTFFRRLPDPRNAPLNPSKHGCGIPEAQSTEPRQSNNSCDTQRHEYSRDVAYAPPYFASINSAPRAHETSRVSTLRLKEAAHDDEARRDQEEPPGRRHGCLRSTSRRRVGGVKIDATQGARY